MPPRRLLTLHAPLARALALPVVRCVEDKLKSRGIITWISAEHLPDVVIMADMDGEEDEDEAVR